MGLSGNYWASCCKVLQAGTYDVLGMLSSVAASRLLRIFKFKLTTDCASVRTVPLKCHTAAIVICVPDPLIYAHQTPAIGSVHQLASNRPARREDRVAELFCRQSS